jgi:hypothetical protein
MKTMSATLLSLLITATQALASGNAAGGEGLSLLATFFIGFSVLVILFQTVPVILLLTGMVKGFLASADKKTVEAGAAGKN